MMSISRDVVFNERTTIEKRAREELGVDDEGEDDDWRRTPTCDATVLYDGVSKVTTAFKHVVVVVVLTKTFND